MDLAWQNWFSICHVRSTWCEAKHSLSCARWGVSVPSPRALKQMTDQNLSGLWIGSEVDDQVLLAAERNVRHLLFPTLTSLPASSWSLVYMKWCLAGCRLHLSSPLTLCCLPKTYKAPGVGGENERLGSFLLPNSATDKLLSASCRVTSTGYTNGPAYAGDKTMGARFFCFRARLDMLSYLPRSLQVRLFC